MAGLLGRSEQALAEQPLDGEQVQALAARVGRLQRRREQLGPVNPLAQEEYAEAVTHVEELEGRRADLETALRELRAVIRETDRQIRRPSRRPSPLPHATSRSSPGMCFRAVRAGCGWYSEEQAPRAVLGGQPLPAAGAEGGDGHDGGEEAAEAAAEAEAEREELARMSCWGWRSRSLPRGSPRSVCRCCPAGRSR